MSLNSFLPVQDADRVTRTLHTLSHYDISGWALTGGFAVELHMLRRGGRVIERPLHDIDFITPSFDSIPHSVGDAFLPRHVHPFDPPGKTLMQCVHPETAVRVDVFRAYGSVMDRTSPVELPTGTLPLISLQDLAARAARLIWELADDRPVAQKFARDFLRLLDIVAVEEIEPAWQEHRKPNTPESFAVTARELRHLIRSRSNLLVIPRYSTDVNAICERCRNMASLRLAGQERILSLLGYC